MTDGEAEFARVLARARRFVGRAREDYLRQECAERPELYREVRAELELEAALPGPESEESRADVLLQQLAAHTPIESRYHTFDEIARGGMGAIYRVWDDDLRRTLAMKVIRSRRPKSGQGPLEMDQRLLERFLEEAQVTGQLDHPGIVPVHELGVAPDGRAYFTMRLVRGQHLGEIFELVRRREDGWNRTRAVSVILRVCEAMAFAHAKGVVHRDLKPANIMVGRFGETYVMDWGLAHVLAGDGSSPEETTTTFTPWRDVQHDEGSPLVTLDGEVLGTPQYMSPEQATGDQARIGPRSDVYSLGAILYELLAGRPPYTLEHGELSVRETVDRVLQGPPTPVERVRSGQPVELVAICEKAMARSVDARYAGMLEMAVDLRAYLENRVVRAHRTGALAELSKWVGRNRTAATLAIVLVVVLAVSGFAVALVQRARLLEERRYTDRALVTELLAEVDRLGPIGPAGVQRRELWLDQARVVAGRAGRYRGELEALRRSGRPGYRSPAPDPVRWNNLAYLEGVLAQLPGWVEEKREIQTTGTPRQADIARREEEILLLERTTLERRVEELRGPAERRRPWVFSDPELQRDHDRLAHFVAGLERLTDPRTGRIQRVEEELSLARELRALSIDREREAWDNAIRSIGDPKVCPAYGGLALEPQVGIVPIGRDPRSGLWEFWHVLSGTRPDRGADGELAPQASSGIVLILLPGGPSPMGRRGDVSVPLDPFFLSKYEMTQGQWLAATGSNPSYYLAGTNWGNESDPRLAETISRVHPVESVVAREAKLALERYGLDLPTEAQWEYACRATRKGAPFVYSPDEANLVHVGGLDEIDLHTPVGSFPPNPFGLHDMQGNVAELCRGSFVSSYEGVELAGGDGEILGSSPSPPVRGAAWIDRRDTPFLQPWAHRSAETLFGTAIGVRPARRLDP